ncbi:MAG: amino acid ABC transporter permease [Betaproteobacteria bacterium]|nr:amino acid ABC transporter permease [Betaproteobacteria bacterium]
MSAHQAQVFAAVAARQAPASDQGLVAALRRHLFGSRFSSITTLILVLIFFQTIPDFIAWALIHPVWTADASLCKQSMGEGACWGVITEKYRVIIFGYYPHAEHWRPLLATSLLLALLVASCTRALWSRWLLLLWLVVVAAVFVILHGGYWGLSVVETDRWGGLPLTVLLASLSIVAAFPLSVLMALGRRSAMPAVSALCTVYIELIRGVPLISVLFMASFMFPLLMPTGTKIDVLLRVFIGITLFAAAYMAEVIRGGLQAIPKGQIEAAQSLGMTYWQTQRKIVLPQALAMVVPGVMNNFIGIFKDTSLVTIVSLYELTGALGLALNSDADWRPFKLEAYLFITMIYFAGCYAMSRYSLWIEAQLSRSRAR